MGEPVGGLRLSRDPTIQVPSLVARTLEREQYEMKIFKDGDIQFPHIVFDGVHFDPESNWGFSFEDSFGRKVSKFGFKTKSEAATEFDRVQREYLSPEFVNVMSNDVKEKIRSLPRAETMEFNNEIQNVFASLGSSEDSNPLNCLIKSSESNKYSQEELNQLENAFVNRARDAWLSKHNIEQATFLAARIRQVETYLPTISEIYKKLHNYVISPNLNARHSLGLLHDLDRIFSESPGTVIPEILKFLNLDNPARFGDKFSKGGNLETAFFRCRPAHIGTVAQNDDEVFPDEQSRHGMCWEEFKIRQTEAVASDFAQILRFQHTWATFSDSIGLSNMNIDVNASHMRMVQHQPYGEWNGTDSIETFMVDSSLMEYADAIAQTSEQLNLHNPDCAPKPEVMRQLSQLINEIRNTEYGLGVKHPSMLRTRASMVGVQESRMTAFSCLDPTYITCIADSTSDLGSSNSHMPVVLLDAESNEAIREIAHPQAVARAHEFQELLMKKIPYAIRCQIFGIFKSYRNHIDRSLTKQHWDEVENIRLHVAMTRQLSLALGPHFDELAPSLTSFMNIPSFRDLMTVQGIFNRLEIWQARLAPEEVYVPSPPDFTPTPRAQTWFPEIAKESQESQEIEGADPVHRPYRNMIIEEEGTICKSIPEAKAALEGWRWRTLDGNWVDKFDTAVESWYSPDIVGGFGSLSQEADAWRAAFTMFDLATSNKLCELVDLHQLIRPEQFSNAYWTAYQLVDSLDEITRIQLYNQMKKFWISPALSYDTNGRISVERLYRPKAREYLLELIESVLDVSGHRGLSPYILQHLHRLTPERIEGISLLFEDPSSQRAQDRKERQKSQNLQLTAQVSSELDRRTSGSLFLPGMLLLRAPEQGRRWFPNPHDVSSFESASSDNEDWVKRSIYLNNIPTNMPCDILHEILERVFGPVENISVHTERTLASSVSDELLSKHQTSDFNDLKDQIIGLYAKKNTVATSKSSKHGRKGSSKEVEEGINSTEHIVVPLEERISQVFATRAGVKRLKTSVEFYVHRALSYSYWLDINWNSVNMIVDLEDRQRAALSTCLTKIENATNDIALYKNEVELGRATSEELSLKLLSFADSMEQELAVAVEINQRVQNSFSKMCDTWDSYCAFVRENIRLKGENLSSFPTNDDALNKLGDELLETHEIETLLPKDTPEYQREVSVLRLKLRDKYNRFVSSMNFLDRLLLVYPNVCGSVTTNLDELNACMREADRRLTIVDNTNFAKYATKVLSETGENKWEYCGVLGRSMNDEYEEARDHSEDDEEEAFFDEEFDEIDEEDEMHASVVAGVEGEFEDYGNDAEDMNLSDRELENLKTFKTFYDSMQEIRLSDRFEKAKSLNQASKRQTSKCSASSFIPRIIPTSGAYAFVTFKEPESFERATKEHMLAFGITLGAEQHSLVKSKNTDAILFPQPKSNKLEHHRATIQYAHQQTGLFIEGFAPGLRYDEICGFLEYILKPAFPGLKLLNATNCNTKVTDGSCYVQFRSHAESRVAHELLKEQIVMGKRLIVGWREKEPHKNMKRNRMVKLTENGKSSNM